MNVKHIVNTLQTMLEEGKITLETKVIVNGEYGYGTDLCGVNICNMAHIDGGKIISEPENVICFGIDAYLYESEDVGYCDMYIDKDDYKSFKEVLNNEM